ncbi:MAG: hypothetical protein PVF58_20945 [Candidatus Methanofastidiosia archaeon]|jgi:hypothetical protein
MSEKYFIQPPKREFIIAKFFLILLISPVLFIFAETIGYIWELFRGATSPGFFDFPLEFYLLFLLIFYIWSLRSIRNVYREMQKNPFLVITEQNLYIDRDMLPPFQYIWGWRKIKLNWSAIKRIEVKKEMFIIYYEKNGKTKSQKVGLKWVENTEDLLATLKMKCQQESITWTE